MKSTVFFLALISALGANAAKLNVKQKSIVAVAAAAVKKEPTKSQKVAIDAATKAKNAHPVLKYVDRNDMSKSTGSNAFLVCRGLWLLLIYQLFLVKDSPILTKALDFLKIGAVPNFERLKWIGIASSFTALRQVFWTLRLSTYNWRLKPALMIGVGVPGFFTTVTMLSIAYNSNADFGTWKDILGLVLFFAGGLTETFSEIQRKNFKSVAANKGKVFTGGLFSLARHINYTGEVFWYTGLLLLTTGNPIIAAAVFAFMTYTFATVAVGEIAVHMEKKYPKEWALYKEKTPYTLIPGVV
jgi:protein-S-isoprenylcysteine O-methyltransferase Ste14